MSTSIYNVPDYTPGTNYYTEDIVRYTGSWNSISLSRNYLYCTSTHLSYTTEPSTTQFDGYTTYYGEVKPKFIWVPSYGSNLDQQPRVLTTKFGDGYESRIDDGINNNLLTIKLTFEQRSLAEITAIIHFLTTRNGKESFIYTHLQPYNIAKKYICRQWNDSQAFYGNYNLTATFEEVVN